MIRCNRKAVKIFDSMKVKDLLKALEGVDPETEVIEEHGRAGLIHIR